MFRDVPVIVTNYTYTLDAGIDYIRTAPAHVEPDSDGKIKDDDASFVPAQCNITLSLETQYNTKKLRETFNLDDFRKGKYLGNDGTGGFV